MCIEGRINRPDLPNSNNQIIICKSHPLSKLLVKECQQKSFHIGREHNLERVISILPQERLDINEKLFENAGIQFFGPILVKLSNKTQANPAKTKRYGVIFTCMATRAVHLEIVGGLTSY